MSTPAHTLNYRPLVIYHGNCADGFSAAWTFWKRLGNQASYHAAKYGELPPDAQGQDVYIVDFSYPEEQLRALAATARTVTLLDHHKSAMEDLKGKFIEFTVNTPNDEHLERTWLNALWQAQHATDGPAVVTCFDMNRSGATLAWDFNFPTQPRPLLLGHIEDRDLWRFRLPHTREIQAMVFSYEHTFENWDKLMACDAGELIKLTASGAAIQRKHTKDVADLLRMCTREMTIAGVTVPAASMPSTMSSDAGHLMAQNAPFAACYWDTATERVFSLRSTDDGADVSTIAAQYGGGGHRNAAGFRVPRSHELAQC